MRTLIFFLIISSKLCASEALEAIPDYSVSYIKDNSPNAKGARIRITCEFDSDYNPSRELRFGINGSNETIQLTAKNTGELFRKPQKAVFQFYYDPNFQEIETDSIRIKKGQVTVISLHFKARNESSPLKKPVIYLYPERDTEISVDLQSKGELTFTYPAYAAGWKGTAHPDGSVTINEKRYPYLFWESEQSFNHFDFELGGFILNRETAVESLEKYLSELGFNDREKTDFITFWGPQIQKQEHVYIQFILNGNCNRFANLTIEPEPQHLNRVYMVWVPMDKHRKVLLKPQKLEQLHREGFDVLEWGGMELTDSVN